MSQPIAPADADPIDHADPLLILSLRAAIETYIRGDYHAARERLLDARALGYRRADWTPFSAFLAVLDSCIDSGLLVSHDVTLPAEGRAL